MGIAELKVHLRRRFSNTENMSKLVVFAFFLVLLVLVPSSDATAPEKCGPDHCGMSCTAGQICKDKKMLCTPEPAKGKDDECCKGYSCTQGEGKIVNTKGKKNGSEFFFQRLLSSFSYVYFNWLDQH